MKFDKDDPYRTARRIRIVFAIILLPAFILSTILYTLDGQWGWGMYYFVLTAVLVLLFIAGGRREKRMERNWVEMRKILNNESS